MSNLPTRHEGNNTAHAPLHIVPDPVKGGYNVYDTSRPQEPQIHFDDRDKAIAFAEEISGRFNTGFTVEENESRHAGRMAEQQF